MERVVLKDCAKNFPRSHRSFKNLLTVRTKSPWDEAVADASCNSTVHRTPAVKSSVFRMRCSHVHRTLLNPTSIGVSRISAYMDQIRNAVIFSIIRHSVNVRSDFGICEDCIVPMKVDTIRYDVWHPGISIPRYTQQIMAETQKWPVHWIQASRRLGLRPPRYALLSRVQ